MSVFDEYGSGCGDLGGKPAARCCDNLETTQHISEDDCQYCEMLANVTSKNTGSAVEFKGGLILNTEFLGMRGYSESLISYQQDWGPLRCRQNLHSRP